MEHAPLNPSICKADTISKRFERQTILKNMSFSISATQFILLTGENGSGKTTLLRLLATLSQPTKGKIEHFNDTFGSIPRHLIRRHIGYLSSTSCLHEDLSLFENLSLILKLMNTSLDSVYLRDLLKFWNLEKVSHRPCKFLSKGELQKGNIIRSLIHKPLFVLWDEPQNGLDSHSQSLLVETLQELRKTECTLICTSHFSHAIQTCFDTQWKLEKGSLKQ